jgi:alkylhydroperoxidase family enzyme
MVTAVDAMRPTAPQRPPAGAGSFFDPKRSWSGRPTQKRPPRSAASFIFKPSRERAALAWAETVTRVADTAIPDDEFESASAVFSEKELADLTIAIGLMNAFNRLAIGFRNPPKAAT